VTLEAKTSGVPMTFGTIHHHIEASYVEVTFGVIHRVESPLSDPASP
jgi:hypothetical protein